MKLESDEVHVVELDDGERHVFLNDGEVADFLMENMDNPKEMVKKAMKREDLEDTPKIVRLEIPPDLLGEKKWQYGKVPFDVYLADKVL